MKGANGRVVNAEDRFLGKLRLKPGKNKHQKRRRRKRGKKKRPALPQNCRQVVKRLPEDVRKRLVATLEFVPVDDPGFIGKSALQA